MEQYKKELVNKNFSIEKLKNENLELSKYEHNPSIVLENQNLTEEINQKNEEIEKMKRDI